MKLLSSDARHGNCFAIQESNCDETDANALDRCVCRGCGGRGGQPLATGTGDRGKAHKSFRLRFGLRASGSKALRPGMRRLPRTGAQRVTEGAAVELEDRLGGFGRRPFLDIEEWLAPSRHAIVRASSRSSAMADYHLPPNRGETLEVKGVRGRQPLHYGSRLCNAVH